MDDRELLEKAANAAGYRVNLLSEERSGWYRWDTPEKMCWDPLTDDGDEARLEADLCMDVEWLGDRVIVHGWHAIYADHGGDKQAARRRAGVLAAAKRHIYAPFPSCFEGGA